MIMKQMMPSFKIAHNTHVYDSLLYPMKLAGVRISPFFNKWDFAWNRTCEPEELKNVSKY